MDDLIKQGAAAFKAGDLETARKLLTEAVKQFPDDERAWGWMYNICPYQTMVPK
jgi:Tfp pilus assembly protein PilF